MISRRAFVLAVSGAVLGAPPGTLAQRASRVYRIGFLGAFGSREGAAPYLEAFRDGLRELGYTEGRNIALEHRFAHGRTEALFDLAAELVHSKVDVIMAGAAFGYFPGSARAAASRLTTTIPIVMLHPDPVGSGLVASLARPGGNITGLSLFNPEFVGKQLALLREVVPDPGPFGVLRNPTNSAHLLSLTELEAAAPLLQVELHVVQARQPDQFDAAFEAMTRARARAALVLGDSMFFVHRVRIADLAKRHRIPTMSVQGEHAEAGGLMAYGANISDIYRRAGIYVGKILNGANPGDLPVEQPAKFDLVINLRTAEALRVKVPPPVLLQASKVIR
jgi:putative tryptophan/tyrosine transport system substrate-binding protein